MTEPPKLLADLNFRQRRVLITAVANGFGEVIAERFA
jgi:hypothetical protein